MFRSISMRGSHDGSSGTSLRLLNAAGQRRRAWRSATNVSSLRKGVGNMMVNTMDMSAPVTRGELREELDRAFEQRLAPLATKAELAQLATKAELAQFATKADLAQFATKADLERLVTKDDLEKRLEPLVTKEFFETRLEAMESKLSAELAKHVKAIEETFQKQVSTFDDKYKELPGRVERLEGAVFREDKPDKPD
ncbi:MAG TPA: hypothetical protein VLM79_08385 [Kofleriaceae bacterium]|nr:hypothetical protein [Kofleriaceae bacterium]